MNQYIYKNSEGREFGPLSIHALQNLIRAGTVTSETLVRASSDEHWKPLKNVIATSPTEGHQIVDGKCALCGSSETAIRNFRWPCKTTESLSPNYTSPQEALTELKETRTTIPIPLFMRLASPVIYLIGVVFLILVVGGFLLYHHRRSMNGWVYSAAVVEKILMAITLALILIPMFAAKSATPQGNILNTQMMVLSGLAFLAARKWHAALKENLKHPMQTADSLAPKS